MMTLASFPAAEILPTALDQQPEHQRGFAHERELRNVDGVIRNQHRTEAVGEVSEPGDNEQHAEDLRHETGSVRQDANRSRWTTRRIRPTCQTVSYALTTRNAWSGSPRTPSATTSWLITARQTAA